jgi:hypothetical protein
MNSNQIQAALLTDTFAKHIYRGTFAADELPRFLSKPAVLVVNSDIRRKPGTHWLGIYVDSNGRGIYFDSYGLKPYIKHHINFMNKLCYTWTYNNVPLQSMYSVLCGEYTILYLCHRARDLSHDEFLYH